MEEVLLENLNAVVPDFKYTIVPLAYGKGGEDFKLGNTTWPETNVIIMAYVKASESKKVRTVVQYVKKKHPLDGIELFLM